MTWRFSHLGIEPSLRKYLKFSIIVHLVFITILLLSPGGRRKKYITGIYRVKLASLPVNRSFPDNSRSGKAEGKDIVQENRKKVALPVSEKQTSRDSKDLKKTEKKVSTPAKLEKSQKTKTEKKSEEEDILAMLNSARKELLKSDARSGIAGIEKNITKEEIITGISLSGKAKEYYDSVEQKIKAKWFLPGALAMEAKKLKTIIGIIVKRDGTIQDAWIEQSSGNIYYDRAALRAVKKATPLPPLPPEIPDKILELGIIF